MVAIPWQLILISPLGITLVSLTTIFFIFLMILIMRTPAMTFLKASFGGNKMILIQQGEDRKMRFRIAKKERSLAFVKKVGYYIVNPGDVNIEAVSKVPMAIIRGSFGMSLDKDAPVVADKLREMGITNWDELFYEDINADDAFKKGIIDKTQHDQFPNSTYKVQRKNLPKPIIIDGNSVTFDDTLDYFSKNVRADNIEAEINYIKSANMLSKLTGSGDLFKWAVILVIVLIGGALAYNMLIASRPQEAAQIGGVVGQGVNAISGNINGTGLV